MAAVRKKVKWSVGRDEPDDLPEFKTNAEIGKPPRGLYRFRISRIQMVENSSGDAMLKIWAHIDDKTKDKKKWNGYTCVENQNVTDVGAPFLKRFLKAVDLTWEEFHGNSIIDSSAKPPEVVQIGKVKFDSVKRPVYVMATTVDDNYEGVDRLTIGRWVKPLNESEEAEEVGDVDAGDDEYDESADEVEPEDAAEFDEDDLREELEDLELADLKKTARSEYGLKAADYKGLDEDDLRELIVETASEQAEEAAAEEEGSDEEGDDDELRDELGELNTTELKKRAREAGLKLKDYKGKSDEEMVDMIIEAEGSAPF